MAAKSQPFTSAASQKNRTIVTTLSLRVRSHQQLSEGLLRRFLDKSASRLSTVEKVFFNLYSLSQTDYTLSAELVDLA